MRRRDLVWPVLGAVGGFAVAGYLGLVAGAILFGGAVWRPVGVLVAAVAAPVAIAVLTLVEASPDDSTTRVFPLVRPVAHQVGVVSALVWIAAALAVWREARGDDDASPPQPATGAGRRLWPLAALVSLAVVGTLVAID